MYLKYVRFSFRIEIIGLLCIGKPDANRMLIDISIKRVKVECAINSKDLSLLNCRYENAQ